MEPGFFLRKTHNCTKFLPFPSFPSFFSFPFFFFPFPLSLFPFLPSSSLYFFSVSLAFPFAFSFLSLFLFPSCPQNPVRWSGGALLAPQRGPGRSPGHPAAICILCILSLNVDAGDNMQFSVSIK